MESKNTQKYIIAAIVVHKPGVLYEVANMFRRRGYNIDSISVGSTEHTELARMTIAINGDEYMIEQIIKQLNKLINVVKVSPLKPLNMVSRELALIKIHVVDSKARSDIIQYANIFRGNVIDVSPDSMIVEITGDSDKIDAFLNLSRSYGIKEVARTGVTALSRGSIVIKE